MPCATRRKPCRYSESKAAATDDPFPRFLRVAGRTCPRRRCGPASVSRDWPTPDGSAPRLRKPVQPAEAARTAGRTPRPHPDKSPSGPSQSEPRRRRICAPIAVMTAPMASVRAAVTAITLRTPRMVEPPLSEPTTKETAPAITAAAAARMTRRRQSLPKRRRPRRSVADGGGGLDDPGPEAAGPEAAGPEALPTGSTSLMPSLTAAMSALTRKTQGVPARTAPSAVSGTACPPSSCARCAATLVAGCAGTRATDVTVRGARGAWNRRRRIDAPPGCATLTALPPFLCVTYPTLLSPLRTRRISSRRVTPACVE